MPDKKKIMKEFEAMRGRAELKALSNVSLERKLTDKEFGRFKELFEKKRKGKL